jgi:hypothetical protein
MKRKGNISPMSGFYSSFAVKLISFFLQAKKDTTAETPRK